MAGNLSQVLQGYIAGWLRGTNFPAAPASLLIALSTTNPTDTGAGITEPGGGYARQPITFGIITSNESPGVSMSNNATIAFTSLGASVISHVAIFTVGGIMLWYGPVSSVKAVQAGSTFNFIVGDVSVTLDGMISSYLGTAIENWMQGTTMPSASTSLLLALSSSDPLRTGLGITRPSGSAGYADQPLTLGAPVFTSGTGTVLLNNTPAIFATATATWNVAYNAVFDSTGTTMFLYGSLTVPQVILPGGGIGAAINSYSLLVT